MQKRTIDKLLTMYFKEKSNNNGLVRLENNVWQKIHAIQSDKSLSWQEKMFLAFGVPGFRLASVTLALVMGLGMGTIISQEQTSLIVSTSQEMGLHVFAANLEYLPSTLLEGK